MLLIPLDLASSFLPKEEVYHTVDSSILRIVPGAVHCKIRKQYKVCYREPPDLLTRLLLLPCFALVSSEFLYVPIAKPAHPKRTPKS